MEEIPLKQAVVGAINSMLDGVRKHFSENAEAKALLETIIAYKKEGVADVATDKKVKCLKVADLPAGENQKRAVVVATKPQNTVLDKSVYLVGVDAMMETLVALKKASELVSTSGGEGNGKVILWLEDWGCFCLDKYKGDKKAIKEGYFATLLE